MIHDLTPFNIQNLSQIVDFVKPMWTFSGWEDFFRDFYAETILRNNYFKNDLAFEITENESLSAAIFLQRLSDKNDFEKWLFENSANFDSQKKESLKLCKGYLEFMDSKVHKLMNEDDIKLSLFVSLKKGSGKKFFAQVQKFLKSSGYKNMYLWTDCECNWQWYIKNGFMLVEESVYEKFSELDGEDYKTYIFKIEIL